MEQYYTKNPTTNKEIFKFDWNIVNEIFHFYTSNSVFSKNGVDFGSMLLIETVVAENKDFTGKVLDMGCGYGPIGIFVQKNTNCEVEMIDINQRSLHLASKNAEIKYTVTM